MTERPPSQAKLRVAAKLWGSKPAVVERHNPAPTNATMKLPRFLDERGKPRYRNFVDFCDRATRDKFAAAVVEAVRREHPEVLA